jgi:hypothetical protein
MGTRSQDTVLGITEDFDGKAWFRSVTEGLDHSMNVDMKCLGAILGFCTGQCQPSCLNIGDLH